jgi:hypothetical protein
MAKTQKKPLSPLRRAFNYAGAVFLSVYFGGPMISAHFGDVTNDISEKLDIPVRTINAATRGPTYILHPETDSAVAFAHLNESPDLRRTIMEHNSGNARHRNFYDFMGLSYSHPFFGQNGFLNKITLGQSGKLAPCYVFFPSDRLDLNRYFETMSDVPAKDVVNRPGTLADYLKLILLHELEHCKQPVAMPADEREFLADQVAYDSYLKHGGNIDVVRAVLSLRMAQTLSNIIFKGGAGDGVETQHSAIALLYPQYFGGTPIPQEAFKDIQNEAYRALEAAAKARGMDSFDLQAPKNLHSVTKDILQDPAQNLSPHTRAFLIQYKEAYEFLTVVPAQKIALKGTVVPKVL